ncbi:hypothetical protein SUGI_1106210 [Cryptomeria japonica]|nr:hypothetical protein SUGI_1106210 [Cryptomeria japonica]
MVNLVSELERFEQEMKELVSDSPPSPSQANNNTSAALNFCYIILRKHVTHANILTAASTSNEITVQSITPAQQSSRSPAAPAESTSNEITVQSITPAQQSSRSPAAPAASVVTSNYLPARPSPIISSNAQLQPQVSTPPASTAPHMQWLGNGAGPALAPSLPVPSVSGSSSSQFTYSSGAYPPGPSNVPSVSATATSGSPYFPLPFHLQQQPEHLQQQQSEQQYPQQQQCVMAQYQPQVQKYTLAPQLQQPPSIQASQYQYSSLYQAPAAVGGIYSLPQQQQAQHLFQKDAQTITAEALESVKAALASSENEQKVETKKESNSTESCRSNMGRSNTCKLARK